jgi:hypothetical protein
VVHTTFGDDQHPPITFYPNKTAERAFGYIQAHIPLRFYLGLYLSFQIL